MARRAAARGSLAEQPALFPIDPTLPATGGALAPYTPAHDAGADDARADDAGAVDRNGVPGFDPLGALPAGTMLLEASAGTGKTYTIASLVLRLVAGDGVAPLDVREILVVTFTQAAATELRERVRARLRDAHQAAVRAQGALAAPAPGAGAAEGGAAGAVAAALAQVAAARRDQVTRDVVTRAHEQGRLDEVAQRLGDALERFDDAPIGTIHGFCSRVLREHAFACGAELDAEPLEDVDALVDELAHDFWVREMADRSPAMVRALVERGKLGLATVRALVRRALAHQDAPCVPACPEASGDECDAVVAARGALARRVAEHWSPSATHDAFEQLDRARADGTLNLNSWRADAIERRVRAVTHWAAAAPATAPCPPDLLYFATGDLARTCKKGKAPPSHPVFDDVQALVDAEARLEAAAGAEALRVRHECVRWARAEAARRKRALRVHGYDDLLRLVRDALRRDCPARGGAGTLATALRASFGAALIDEFQDTDPAQWEIFHRAFGDAAHRLVLIGDPKQAIYRFRGADVDAYLDARAHAEGRTFALAVNRRTDGALVDALHAAFGRHHAPFAVERIAWSPVRAQHARARLTGGGAPLTVRFLPRDGVFAPDEAGRAGSAPVIPKEVLHARLPELVAADVVRFLASGARVEEEGRPARPVRPADVAVLVRSHRQARQVQAALQRAGVPAVLHGATSVFASDEAEQLAAVLAAVLEPSDRLMRAALATDLLGLAAIAELSPDGTAGPGDALALLDGLAARDAGAAWGAAADAAQEGGWDAWGERFRRWLPLWRGEAPGRHGDGGAASPMRLVRAILDELSLPARLLARADGERRLTNLLHLGELLHAAAVAEGHAPGATLAWLRAQIARGDSPGRDDARQLRLESDEQAAQVVTVHSSKGLEYGAVWCPWLWDGRLASEQDRALPCVPLAAAEGAPAGTVRTLDLAATKGCESVEREDDECFAEALRLAYVALTRARHRVTLWWGGAKDAATSPLGWLLHGERGDGATPRLARTAVSARLKGAGDEVLRARLLALQAAAPAGAVAVVDEEGAPPGRHAGAADEPPALAARPWTRTAALDDGWRLGSFTGLTAGAHATYDPRAAADADDPVGTPEALGDTAHDGPTHDGAPGDEASDPEATSPGVEAPVPLAAFPRSAAAGIFFHEVLERHDVAEPAQLAERVGAALAAHGFGDGGWTAVVTAELARTLEAPLARAVGGTRPLRLVEVPAGTRLAELRFELPAVAAAHAAGGGEITPAALARAIAEHPGGALDRPGSGIMRADYAGRVAALGFRPLRGFLTGAIDLVARDGDGRWWLVDYKSNHLGARRADYAPARLGAAMADAHYVLQYHLYALALARWLAWRTPGFDWDRDVGGVCYVFLRGIGEPGDDGLARTGVFVDRLPGARVAALDRLFREGR